MSDVFTKAKRSAVMSRIRSRGNRDTELALAKLFRRHAITGWRRQWRVWVEKRETRVEGRQPAGARRSAHDAQLAIRPDFVFPP